MVKYVIAAEMHEISNDLSESEDFDESYMELSAYLDDMESCEFMCNDSLYDQELEDDALNVSAASSDSKFSEESSYDCSYETADDICKQLLLYCESKSDRRNAVRLSSLLQDHIPELFLNTRHCVYGIGVPSLVKFAHEHGDMHTALNAILAWTKARHKHKNMNMSTWCKTHGVNFKTMKLVMKYVDDLNYLWKNEESIIDNGLGSDQCMDGKIHTMLTDVYEKNLCYYLGHPDLGYKSFLTGHQIPCCTASSLNLLDQLPKFVITCKARHQHLGNEHMCHYMVAVDDVVGLRLARRLFSASLEGCGCFINNKVSEVSERIRCGTDTSHKLHNLWSSSSQAGLSLQRELSNLIDDNHTIIDIVDNRDIKIYAPARYHTIVLEFVQDKVHAIRLNIPRKRITASFPSQQSGMKLLICHGVQCKAVYMPGNYIPEQHQDNRVFESQNMFRVSTEVGMYVGVGVIPSCDIHGCIAKLFGRVLISLYHKLWGIQDMDIGQTHVVAQLVFKTHVAARRALLLITDEPDMDVINVTDIENQCRLLTLHINGRVFATAGDFLMSKLDKLSRSQKYNIKYDIAIDHMKNVVLSISTMTSQQVSYIWQKIHHVFIPLRFTLQETNKSVTDIHSKECTFILDHIGRLTNTWLQPSKNIKEQSICIYGQHESKKAASTYLQKYVTVNLHLNNKESLFHLDFAHNVDMQTASSVCLRRHSIQLLHSQYRVEVPEEPLILADNKDISTCVVCLTGTMDFYMLEGCGHIYCHDCLNTQIDISLRDNIIPICCAHCDMLFTTVDVRNLIKSRRVPACTRRKMYQAALDRFVALNHQLFRLCPIPNCGGVFKIQPKVDGGLNCGACNTDICDSCYERAHYRSDCIEYTNVIKWMKEDPKHRKKCPKCRVYIENYGVCSFVRCQYCQTNICFYCLRCCYLPQSMSRHMRSSGHYYKL